MLPGRGDVDAALLDRAGWGNHQMAPVELSLKLPVSSVLLLSRLPFSLCSVANIRVMREKAAARCKIGLT